MLVTTPNVLTLAGGLIHMGMSNVSVAISIALSVPTGTCLLLNVMLVKLTTLKLVQSR